MKQPVALQIRRNGIVQRHTDGAVTILRPGKNGGPGTEIEVPADLADAYRLATGDIVAGETQPILDESPDLEPHSELEMPEGWDIQYDEPTALRYASSHGRDSQSAFRFPAERLTEITRINGLDLEEAGERPFPRTNRSRSERTPPDRLLEMAVGPNDATGRMLDFAAPLGAGVFGVIYGPHGGGLTRTLQTVLKGIMKSAPECVPMVLLLRPRPEEVTEWPRWFPNADIVVGSSQSAAGEGTPVQTLRLCSLVLEAAQRQTELGRDVVLMIDSLTTLWGAMLEGEEADAQHEADTSAARQRMREWTQKAGCFHGAGPLGGGLGGTLTILGTVWNQAIDEEAEEERDIHPHLRLLEHVLPEASWLVALSETLTQARLYPAIDLRKCRSQYEERLLPADIRERLLTLRGSLPRSDAPACYVRLMDALDRSADMPGLLDALASPAEDPSPPAAPDRPAERHAFWTIDLSE